MKKVLFVLPTPWSMSFGGLDVQFEQTRIHLQSLGVRVVTVDYFDRALLDGIDLVHFFGFGPMYYHLGRVLQGMGMPYVVSTIFYSYGKRSWVDILRGRALSRLPETYHSLNRKFLSGASAYLPNSQAEAKQLITHLGLDDRKIHVVPNGVEGDFFGQEEIFRERMLPDSFPDKFAISVARIVPRKNTLNLMNAAVKFGVPLIIIGPKIVYGHQNSPEHEFVRQVDKLLGHNPETLLHIPMLNRDNGDLANAMAAAHVHALVSILETPGLASLEAGLNGCNLVTGRCPPVHEYFGTISLEVDQHDIDGIGGALREAMRESKNSLNQSEYIAQRYTWAKVAEKTLKAYESVFRK